MPRFCYFATRMAAIVLTLIFASAHLSLLEAGPQPPMFSGRDSSQITIRLDYWQRSPNQLSFLPEIEPVRARIGIALSGGGARAISQIGVLQVFEEHGIPIDVIVGTSMGSIIGGLYAAGYTPAELVDIVKSIRWEEILNDRPPRRSLFIGKKQEQDRLLLQIRLDGLKPYIPPALTPGQRLQSILSELVLNSPYAAAFSFDEFRIPFRAVSTDLYSGQRVILSQGDPAEAMRASLAFPLLFTPVPLDGKLLADGGLVDNIPVDVVRQFPVDVVIAVDATSNLRKADQLNAPWEIADQVTTIMQRDRNEASRRQADFLIRLRDDQRINTDFSDIEGLIAAGRKEALAILPALRARMRALQRAAYHHADAPKELTVHGCMFYPESLQIRFAADGWLTDSGSTITIDSLRQQLEQLFQAGDFRDVRAQVTTQGRFRILKVIAEPNPVLDRVIFSGNSVFPEDTLQAAVRSLLHRPLNPKRTRRQMEALLKSYRRAGYSLARITSLDYDAESRTGYIRIDEGRIDTIEIRGNLKTRDHVILREFSP